MDARRRRLGFALAATIAGLAVVIAALPSIQAGGSVDLDGPAIVPRPIVVALLLALPAGLAAIAAFWASRPMFVAAGVLCLLQSVVAFSGVTLGFVVPGLLVVWLGLGRTQPEPPKPTQRHECIVALFAIGLGIGAWVVPFATSENLCWIAMKGPGGELVYTRVGDTGSMTLGPNDLGGGCASGTFTVEGLTVGSILAIGALAMAGLAGGIATGPLCARPDR
jgi:hypothetical protein